MLRHPGMLAVVAGALSGMAPTASAIAEATIEPRLSGGTSYYDLDLDGEVTVGDDSVDDIEFDDWLYFVGGGVTISFDRFFIDFSGQYSFDGDEDLNLDVVSGGVVVNDLAQDVDFDRFEAGIAVGYRITDHFAGYIGYRYADVDFDGSGSLGAVGVDFSTDFEQHGPLIGASYAIPKTILNGTLVLNGAVTYLNGDLENELDADAGIDDVSFDIDGDAIGFNGGLSWAAPISEQAKFVLGGDVSSYQFDDDDDETDFDELIVRLRAEVRYSFDTSTFAGN
ncbi:MAG: hypothetical protein ACR2QJ_03625 [Geminicoccaceae bacterium]